MRTENAYGPKNLSCSFYAKILGVKKVNQPFSIFGVTTGREKNHLSKTHCILDGAASSSSQRPFVMDNYPFVDEHEEEEDQQSAIVLVAALFFLQNTFRSNVYVHNRIDWQFHVYTLQQESPDAFERMYRMSLISFDKLCLMIRPFMYDDPIADCRSSHYQKIELEVMVHCLLRWLAGGSHLDVHILAGIGKPTFYACCYKVIDALNACNDLAIKFPQAIEQIE
jgi:hypothetical protein